ncbi:hypothetical protein M9X92_003150 [Pyricularia oryzae]|nr:hypothetical protein M9X92_003150 [Pyricularia oryzae]
MWFLTTQAWLTWSLGQEGQGDVGPDITAITWDNGYERSYEAPGERAKKQAVYLCRCSLRCDFGTLPEYDYDVL